jgi:hypothetical protein
VVRDDDAVRGRVETYKHVGSGFDRGGADVRQERDRREREQVRMHLGLALYRRKKKKKKKRESKAR